MKRLFWILLLIGLAVLATAARAWNLRDVFVEGKIYFVDADCYSRMTRARMVDEGQWIIQRHTFENWPEGTQPHTTAPLDWLIVAGKRALDLGFKVSDPEQVSVLHRQTLDVAGAVIPLLCGAVLVVWLGGWALRWAPVGGRWAAGLLMAVSPIAVHGTLLGRPDHQALLLVLMAIALGLELAIAAEWGEGKERLRRVLGVMAGLAWGVAWWVSLYEPVILWLITFTIWLVADRRRFTAREMWLGWGAFVLVFALAVIVDGWRISWPDAALREAFMRWKSTIGELNSLDPTGPLLYRWLGWLILPAPVLLILAGRQDRRAWALLAGLVAAFALTVWQLRWGYFLALIFAFSLPWQLAVLRRAWIIWPVTVIAFWPLAQDWEERLFPEDLLEIQSEKKRALLRLEAMRLREVAEVMRSSQRQPFLAPWWLSPSLAYWSGQPGVAGSSHQSLPGILASARFYLAPNAGDAARLAQERKVFWVVTDDPDRLVATSQALLGDANAGSLPYVALLHEKGEPRERVTESDLRAVSEEARQRLLEMASRAEAVELGSSVFSCISKNQFYKLFSVRQPEPQP